MARVSTARTRAARRDEIARVASMPTPKLRLRWGRICAYLLALTSGAVIIAQFLYMVGEFMDRL
jgi:hypothetical protein